MILAAQIMVVIETVFFIGLTVAALVNFSEVSPATAYTLIGMQFAGLCVIASWHRRTRRMK